MDYNKLILVEQHFYLNVHDFNWDTKFNILERIEKKLNKKEKEKERRNKRIGQLVFNNKII